MMKVNWRNIAENLIITLISVMVGVFIGYKVSVKTSEVMLESLKTTIELAIKKETTSITNQVRTEIRKIKSNKSGEIDLIIDPNTSSTINQTKDSTNLYPIITSPKERGFFKRLFNSKKTK